MRHHNLRNTLITIIAVSGLVMGASGCAAASEEEDMDPPQEEVAEVSSELGSTAAPSCVTRSLTGSRDINPNPLVYDTQYSVKVANRCAGTYTVRLDIIWAPDTSCARLAPGQSKTFLLTQDQFTHVRKVARC
jgi:hypothetical protein